MVSHHNKDREGKPECSGSIPSRQLGEKSEMAATPAV